eukprot:Gregarina_sp_Poly_1__1772@NODE_145_length_12880_cov_78_207602_g130_i0_p1_GENE_NODE_145_length_12880_cov_78_207602_g130_i0NODE_145_length_12880_cov_78_207602_g130_i0_p1_ORF_typecomplete_len1881_score278_22_NODE_145_length_12880_cov_78_207602_g130_i0533610978
MTDQAGDLFDEFEENIREQSRHDLHGVMMDSVPQITLQPESEVDDEPEVDNWMTDDIDSRHENEYSIRELLDKERDRDVSDASSYPSPGKRTYHSHGDSAVARDGWNSSVNTLPPDTELAHGGDSVALHNAYDSGSEHIGASPRLPLEFTIATPAASSIFPDTPTAMRDQGLPGAIRSGYRDAVSVDSKFFGSTPGRSDEFPRSSLPDLGDAGHIASISDASDSAANREPFGDYAPSDMGFSAQPPFESIREESLGEMTPSYVSQREDSRNALPNVEVHSKHSSQALSLAPSLDSTKAPHKRGRVGSDHTHSHHSRHGTDSVRQVEEPLGHESLPNSPEETDFGTSARSMASHVTRSHRETDWGTSARSMDSHATHTESASPSDGIQTPHAAIRRERKSSRSRSSQSSGQGAFYSPQPADRHLLTPRSVASSVPHSERSLQTLGKVTPLQGVFGDVPETLRRDEECAVSVPVSDTDEETPSESSSPRGFNRFTLAGGDSLETPSPFSSESVERIESKMSPGADNRVCDRSSEGHLSPTVGTPRRVPTTEEGRDVEAPFALRLSEPEGDPIASVSQLKRAPSRKSASQRSPSVTSSSENSVDQPVSQSRTPGGDAWNRGLLDRRQREGHDVDISQSPTLQVSPMTDESQMELQSPLLSDNMARESRDFARSSGQSSDMNGYPDMSDRHDVGTHEPLHHPINGHRDRGSDRDRETESNRDRDTDSLGDQPSTRDMESHRDREMDTPRDRHSRRDTDSPRHSDRDRDTNNRSHSHRQSDRNMDGHPERPALRHQGLKSSARLSIPVSSRSSLLVPPMSPGRRMSQGERRISQYSSNGVMREEEQCRGLVSPRLKSSSSSKLSSESQPGLEIPDYPRDMPPIGPYDQGSIMPSYSPSMDSHRHSGDYYPPPVPGYPPPLPPMMPMAPMAPPMMPGSGYPYQGQRQKYLSDWYEDGARICGHWECKVPWLDAQFKFSIGRKAKRPDILSIAIRVSGVGSKLRGDRLLRQSSSSAQERWKFNRLDFYQSDKQWPPIKEHILWKAGNNRSNDSKRKRDIYHHGKGEIFFFKSLFRGVWASMVKAQYLLLCLCRMFSIELPSQIPINSIVLDAFNFSPSNDLSNLFNSVIRNPDTEIHRGRVRTAGGEGQFYWWEAVGFDSLASFLLAHISIPGLFTFDITKHDGGTEEAELAQLFPSLLETETSLSDHDRKRRSSATTPGSLGQNWIYQMPGASEEELGMLSNNQARRGLSFFYWDPESRIRKNRNLPFLSRHCGRLILLNLYSGRCMFFDIGGVSGKVVSETFGAFLLHLRFPSARLLTPDPRYFDFIRFRQQSVLDDSGTRMASDSQWRRLEKIFQQWMFESHVSPWQTSLQCAVEGAGRDTVLYYSVDLHTIEKEVPKRHTRDTESSNSSSHESVVRGGSRGSRGSRGRDRHAGDGSTAQVIEQFVSCQILSNIRRPATKGVNPLLQAPVEEIGRASFKLFEERETSNVPSLRTLFTIFRSATWFLQCLHWIASEASRFQANRDIGSTGGVRRMSNVSSVFQELAVTEENSRVLHFFKSGIWAESQFLHNLRQQRIQQDESHGLRHEKLGLKIDELDITYTGSKGGSPRQLKSDSSKNKKKPVALSASRKPTVLTVPPLQTVCRQAVPAFCPKAGDPALRSVLPPTGVPLHFTLQPTGASYLQPTLEQRDKHKKHKQRTVVDTLMHGGSIVWGADGSAVSVGELPRQPQPLDVVNIGPGPDKETIRMRKAVLARPVRWLPTADGHVSASSGSAAQLRVPRDVWTSTGWAFPGSRAAIRSALERRSDLFPPTYYTQPYLGFSAYMPTWGFTQPMPALPGDSFTKPAFSDEMVKAALLNNPNAHISQIPFQPPETKFNPGASMRFA